MNSIFKEIKHQFVGILRDKLLDKIAYLEDEDIKDCWPAWPKIKKVHVDSWKYWIIIPNVFMFNTIEIYGWLDMIKYSDDGRCINNGKKCHMFELGVSVDISKYRISYDDKLKIFILNAINQMIKEFQ